jgi:eukaryotic-like serine/threonine-protein kinase
MALAAGAQFGPYEIVSTLGAGGMGEVYRARDNRLGRTVAIKILRQDAVADPARVDRFEREARSASALNHPNIVTIYDVGVVGLTSYIAMEWIEGASLRDILAGPVKQTIADIVKIGAQIAEGLAKAHGAGIVHRDLKPDNVMVTGDGLAKILDFGLAKLAAPADDLGSQLATKAEGTAEGVLLGTVGYMSPEQAVGAAVDYRSDQFALGIILYELATGSRAFRRNSAPQTLAAIIEDEPERVETLNPRVPPQLSHIIARCLAKKPDDRYESTRDLARDLRDVIVKTSTSKAPAAHRFPYARAGAVAASVAAIGAAAWFGTRSLRTTKPPAEDPRRTVAVLPFKDLTGDPSRAYFAAGVTDEIRGQLARLGALRLLSRSAVQRYDDGNMKGLRADLGAGSVVEGSVRVDGARVRVTVDLVDTSTEQTLWTDQYDRTLDDVLTVQTDVAMRIAEALKAALTVEERRSVARPPTANAKAYELYLRSKELSIGTRETNRRGIELLNEALKLDPLFAGAQATLAYRTQFLASYDDPKYNDVAIEQARRAIDMDPTLARGYFALASAYGAKGWAAKSRAAFLKALELDRGETGPVSNLAVLESEILGRHDEALAWARRLLDLPPVTAGSIYHIAWPLIFLRDDDASARWLTETESQDPGYLRVQYLHAVLEYLRGNESDAVSRARTVVDKSPNFEEGLAVLAELTFFTNAADAEAQIERRFAGAPGLLASPVLKMETYRTTYASLLMRRGERARAEQLLAESAKEAQAALADNNEHQRVPIEIAAIHAIKGEKDQALDWLERGVTAGYRDYSTLGRDPIFHDLRREARFEAVLKKMEQAVAAMRAGSAALAELRSMPVPRLARTR